MVINVSNNIALEFQLLHLEIFNPEGPPPALQMLLLDSLLLLPRKKGLGKDRYIKFAPVFLKIFQHSESMGYSELLGLYQSNIFMRGPQKYFESIEDDLINGFDKVIPEEPITAVFLGVLAKRKEFAKKLLEHILSFDNDYIDAYVRGLGLNQLFMVSMSLIVSQNDQEKSIYQDIK